MIQCTFCRGKSELQCSNCNEMLLCTPCSLNHADNHQILQTKAKIEPINISLSHEKLRNLRDKIRISLDTIKNMR